MHKDMVLKNMIIRKVYLLAGVIMAANMFVGNEVRAMEGNKKLDTKPEENKEEPKPEEKKEEPKVEIIQEEPKPEEKKKESKTGEDKEGKKNEKLKLEGEKEKNKKGKEKNVKPKYKNLEKGKIKIKVDPEKEKIKAKVNPEKEKIKVKKEDKKEEEQKKSIRMLKTLRWCCFSAKPIVSLLWSFANSIYHFEKIELNKVYFFKYILCVGYRWQAGFMKKSGLFFDVNINAVSVMHSIFCTIIKYNIDLDCHENKVCTWKWFLGKSIFYTLPNSLNLNLNIKFKDSYFAINLAGIMAEIISRLFSQNAGLNVETIKKEINKKV